MIFITGNLFLFYAVLGLICYLIFVKVVLPAFWRSRPYRRFKQRVSQAIRRLFFNLRDEVVSHLITLCEHEGDEPLEPYMDSPLRTCPPCTFVNTPPKEGALVESNNNLGTPPTPPPPPPTARRGRGRGRMRDQERVHNDMLEMRLRLQEVIHRALQLEMELEIREEGEGEIN